MKKKNLVKPIVAQSLKGHGFSFSEESSLREVRLKPSEKPYRVIEGVPVFHEAQNECPFVGLDFDSRKLHKWGSLLHPCIVLASYPIEGSIKFYIDTRSKGWFVMWAATFIHDEFNDRSYDIIAWTPKQKGESLKQAGYRLCHAALLEILMANENSLKADPDMKIGFEGSKEIAEVLARV